MKLTVETIVDAPLARVWDAYVTPEDIVQWNAASDDWHTPRATVDLRPGGKFCSRMEARDGSFGFDFEGTYTRIEPRELIEYDMGDRSARVEFVAGESGTRVSVTFDAEGENDPELQRAGWQAILDNFKRHVEAGRYSKHRRNRVTKMIFVNLPVADLAAAKAFYSALGFVNEPRFTDETAAAMQWSDTIVVMLLSHAKWREFTERPIATGEVLLCVSMEDRAAVDAIVEAATANGGSADPTPQQDHGFMYGRSFADPDGHIWEPMWMDPAMAEGGPPEHEATTH